MTTPSRWAQALTTLVPSPKLDLADWVGQRPSSYTFTLVDSLTGYTEAIHPVRDTVPILRHDTNQTIKRQVNNIFLSVADTAKVSAITSRLHLTMEVGGDSYPLGVYMPNGQLRFPSTVGDRSSLTLYDESFIINQEIISSFSAQATNASLEVTLRRFLRQYPVAFTIEPTPFTTSGAWSVGTLGGYVVEQMALDGDWFSPWFDNTNVMRFIRSFDPDTAIPRFNFDDGNKVVRNSITVTDNLIDSPNRFVILSNGVSAAGDNAAATVGVYDIPSTAPNSAANRGFVVAKTEKRQMDNVEQAQAVARNLALRYPVFETAALETAPDPRHDSYDVVRWRGVNWLETGWSLPLSPDANMTHTMRRVYSDD